MSALALGLTLLLALAAPSSSAALSRRQAGTVHSNCNHDFALTWDDGPYLWTDEIVDEFDCVGGKTTFFVSGNYESCIYSEDNVQRLRYAFEAGHQIAAHGWSHADFSTLSNAQIDVEIQRLDEAIIKILGVKPRFFRAPNGSIPSSAATYIQNTYGKTIVSYDVDSGDANAGATTEDSYQFYANLASQGPGHPHLALSHETMPNALDALDQGTINLLGSAGIQLITAAQCLDAAPYETIGNYGVRDSSWTCDGAWTPSTPTCQQTYTATASDKTCALIASKFGLSGSDIAFANPYLNCEDVWQWTPVCIPPASSHNSVTCVQTYTSVSGDSCASIGAKFGVSAEDIYEANTFVTCDNVWAGTSFCIPAATTTPSASCSTTYTAQSGDTCNSIAHKFGVTSAAIQAANTFVDCSNIWAYTPICVPSAGSTVTPTTTSSTTTSTTTTTTSTTTITTSTSTTSTTSSTSTTTTTSTTSAPTCVQTYTAGTGETCQTIANRFGLSASAIQAANTFLNCADVWQWTPVCIPPGGATTTTTTTTTRTTTRTSSTAAPSCVSTYTSVSGDTCSSIATKFGLTSSAIQAANTFLTCNDIWAFTPICIPSGGTPPATCTQTYYTVANDTCDSIGAKFGVSGAQILAWNSFLTCSDIWVNTPVCV